jgi:phosphatidylglycerophosphate synthase
MCDMLTRLKSLSDERLLEIGKALHRVGLTPNRLSILGLILIAICAWFLYHEQILLAILFGAIGALADVMDGMVARTTNQKTIRGGFLDSMIDRYADTLIIGSMLLGGWLSPLEIGSWEWEPLTSISGEAWAIGAMSGALLTSYARAAAERLGVKQEGIGWVERPERMVILLLGLVAGIVTWALFLLTFLGHITVLQRAKHFWEHAES